MVFFEELEENGQLVLSAAVDSKAMADGLSQKFPVYPSMLRPGVDSDPNSIRRMFPVEMTYSLNAAPLGGPQYLLKGLLKENKSEAIQPPLLGRRIARGIVRWGANYLKMAGDFTYIPLYWDW